MQRETMTSDMNRIPIETLLAETQWVRALAGSLVRDDAAADDVVQETYRAALSNPPRAGVPVRAWLRTVVRNFARRSYREKQRRRTREHAVAAPERDSLPGPDELAERLDSQRAVARLVASLEEPFRSTLLLRYWEGLSSAEISRRQEIPAGTVRWRLKKARDDLRARLDAEHDGNRSAWVALLLPIVSPQPEPATTAGASALAAAVSVGGIIAVKKAAIAAALLVFVGLSLYLTGWLEADLSPVGPNAPEELPSDGAPVVAKAEPEDAEPSNRPATGAGNASVEEAADRFGPATVSVRFVDEEGRPIEGVVLKPGGDAPPVRSGADGRAVVTVAMRSRETWARIEVNASGYASRELKAAVRTEQASPLGDVVLEPGGAVSGMVIGPDGSPAGDASVRLAKPAGPLDLFSGLTVDGPVSDFKTITKADGSFLFEGVPVGFWRVFAGGNGLAWTATEPVEIRAERQVEGVTLRPAAKERNEGFEIVVFDPDGHALPDATIEYHLRNKAGRFLMGGTTHADEEGRVTFRQAAAAFGDFTARDRQERYQEASVEDCRAGGKLIVLRLTRGRPFALVVTASDGAALAAFKVVFLSTDRDKTIREAPGRDGTVELIPPPGAFHIRVEADAHQPEIVGPFTRDTVPAVVRVTLKPLPGIRGIATAGGRPIGGAKVVAHAVADPRWYEEFNGFIVRLLPGTVAETVTEQDGSFSVYPVRAGQIVLRVEADGFAPAESEVLEYEPATGCADISIAITRGGVLRGAVIDPTGGDVSGTIVGISRGDTYGRTVRVGADGEFRFERLTPGPFEVVIREEEILPERNSSVGGGPAKPIPFNCRIAEGETTVFDLHLPGEPATLNGRILIDGKAPRAWKAGLYPTANSLIAETKTDVGADGKFCLRAPDGDWRLLVTSPGGTHVSTVVVADLHLAGEAGWECDLTTGPLVFDRPTGIAADAQLYHRIVTPQGVLVLTPVNTGDAELRVPVGKGEIVRFDLAVWSKPELWPLVTEVEVRSTR